MGFSRNILLQGLNTENPVDMLKSIQISQDYISIQVKTWEIMLNHPYGLAKYRIKLTLWNIPFVSFIYTPFGVVKIVFYLLGNSVHEEHYSCSPYNDNSSVYDNQTLQKNQESEIDQICRYRKSSK